MARAKPRPKRTPIDQRSPLRQAVEAGDLDAMRTALLADTMQDGECWIWQRQVRRGYAVVVWSGRDLFVHRVVLEAAHGAPLGTQAAHHRCGNSACVNPDHLQPVTHRDNVAEMLARRSYLARIRELEDALSEAIPDHPLLTRVPLAG